MSATPLPRGGAIPSAGPECDLAQAILKSGHDAALMWAVDDWLESGLSLEDWRRRRDIQGGGHGDHHVPLWEQYPGDHRRHDGTRDA